MDLPAATPRRRVRPNPPPGLFELAIRPEDIGYTHPIFMQCFLPVRHNATNAARWQTDCGRASLVVRAGELVRPTAEGTFRPCVVPAGPKARLLVAYVNNYIFTKRTRVVPLGESLRQGMTKMGIQIGGKNGQELQREIENLFSSEVILGGWNADGSVNQRQAKVGYEISLWNSRAKDQPAFWESEMTVSADYYHAITADGRMAPAYWPALVGLQHNPRAMDIHSYLVYRLRSRLMRPVTLRADVVHSLFGQDIKQIKHFWPRFRIALAEAHRWYPTARVELLPDHSGLVLRNSPSLIEHRKLNRIA